MHVRQLLTGCLVGMIVAAKTSGAGPVRFDPDVRPILEQHCGKCHGEKRSESGLTVSTVEQLRQGGDSGPAIVPGSAEQSLLYRKIAKSEMPPDDPLAKDQVLLIRQWLDEGALSDSNSKSAESVPATEPYLEPEVFTRVFFTHCISCHGKSKQEAGLDLRTRETMLKGGKSGPVLVLGHAEASLVVRRLANDEMPPKVSALGDDNYVRRVGPDDIEILRKWINAGAPSAPYETPAAASTKSSRGFWSFQPPQRAELSAVAHKVEIRNAVDAFVLAKLESQGLDLSSEAPKLALLRRVYFDLTGLPPTPVEVIAFSQDRKPDAYERLVDRLLDSPRYGERWAQFWLDGAGYADSHGKIDRDQFRPYIWRYRDYVIRSFNADKPYDQFLLEQLAGDELVAEAGDAMPAAKQIEALIATGFLLTAPDATDEAAFNFVPNRMGVLADQLDILSTSVMGITMECARCHNHKFDPISQRDYYRMSAIFQAALDPYDWRLVSQTLYPKRIPLDRRYQRYVYHPADAEPPELTRFNQPIRDQIAALDKQLETRAMAVRQKLAGNTGTAKDQVGRPQPTTLAGIAQVGSSNNDSGAIRDASAESRSESLTLNQLAAKDPEFQKELQEIRGKLAALQTRLIEPLAIHGVRDMGGDPTPVFLLRRGEPRSPGPRVNPGVPSSLEEFIQPYRPAALTNDSSSSGNRLGFARWLIQPRHPLTARVIVNRLWQQHFGRGLVATPGNFGEKGIRPTHPELLDWLATELVRQKWSLKAINRLIVTSAVYRQSSVVEGQRLALDPDNALFSRFPLRRLEGDVLRDTMLQISDQLDLTPFGPPDNVVRTPGGEVVTERTSTRERRSIYLAKMRLRPLTMLEQFDGAEMTPNCLIRTSATVPTQALELQNSQFARDCAVGLANAVRLENDTNDQEQLRRVFLRAFGRFPTREERQSSIAAIEKMRAAWSIELAKQPADRRDPRRLAWEKFCSALLNAPEFLYVD